MSFIDYSAASLYESAGMISKISRGEPNCQEKLRDEIYNILTGYACNPKLASLVLQFLIITVGSQKSFCDFIIKSDGSKHMKEKNFIAVLYKTLVDRNNTAGDKIDLQKVYGYWIILLATLLENETTHEFMIKKFISAHEIFNEVLVEIQKTVKEMFVSSNRSGGASQKIQKFLSDLNNTSKVTEVFRQNQQTEEATREECFSLFVQLKYIEILSRETLRRPSESSDVISNLLNEFLKTTAGGICERIANDGLTRETSNIAKGEFEYLRHSFSSGTGKRQEDLFLNTSYSDLHSAIYSWTLNAGALKGSTMNSWQWNILYGINEYGYGRNWCIDALELWFGTNTGKINEKSFNRLFVIGNYNLEASLADVETKCLIAFNQILSLLIADSDSEQLHLQNFTHVIAKWKQEQSWPELIKTYKYIIDLMWDSIKPKLDEEDLSPFDMYKLKHKLTTLMLCFNGLNLIYKTIYEQSTRKINSEEEGEESKRSAEAQIVAMLPDINPLITRNVQGCFKKYNVEDMLTTFNLFLVSFLQFAIDSQIELDKEKEMILLSLPRTLTQELEISEMLSTTSTTYQSGFFPILVSSLEQIVKLINDAQYVNIFDINKSMALKLLLSRLLSPNCPEADFLAIIKFFIAYATEPKVFYFIKYIGC